MVDLGNEEFSLEKFYDKVSEQLECFICFNIIQEASACPKCSKFGCLNCFKKWIDKGDKNCPFCRQTLKPNEIVKLTVLDDINSWLKNINLKTSNDNLCKLHEEKLSVMCVTCNQLICSQCGLFCETHAEHSFEPIDQVYNKYKAKLQTTSKTLEDDIEQLKQVVHDIIKTNEDVQEKYKSGMNEMLETFQQITVSESQELESKMNKLDVRLKSVSEAIQLRQNQLKKTENSIKIKNMVEFVRNFDQLSSETDDLITKSSDFLTFPPLSIDPINKIVPPYETTIVVYREFSYLKSKAESVYSESIETDGCEWKLCLYPNGYDTGESEYLSVFIELFDGPPISIEFDCCVEMVNQFCNNSSENIVFQRSANFEIGKKYGMTNFFQLKLLQSSGFLDKETDSLVFKIKIRPSNYYYKSLIANSCLDKLQKKYRELLIS